MLIDVALEPTDVANLARDWEYPAQAHPRSGDLGHEVLTPQAAQFIAAGRARFAQVHCFDFVPSDYELAWRTLQVLPRGRFCEWGSGWGIVTGLAELLGFQACGIEIDGRLAQRSRELFAEFGLSSQIIEGDYLAVPSEADVYFVYCWPTLARATEEHFERTAPPGARLLIANGQSDFRCKIVAPDVESTG